MSAALKAQVCDYILMNLETNETYDELEPKTFDLLIRNIKANQEESQWMVKKIGSTSWRPLTHLVPRQAKPVGIVAAANSAPVKSDKVIPLVKKDEKAAAKGKDKEEVLPERIERRLKRFSEGGMIKKGNKLLKLVPDQVVEDRTAFLEFKTNKDLQWLREQGGTVEVISNGKNVGKISLEISDDNVVRIEIDEES